MTFVPPNTEIDSDVRALTMEELVYRIRSTPQDRVSAYYEELIRRFEPLLRRTWRRTAFRSEYEDFLQDVILRLLASLPRLENPRAFPGYFRTIVLSVAVDQHRRQARTPLGTNEGLDEIASRVDEELLAGLFIRAYFEELPFRERQVLTFQFVDGFSTSKVASMTGLTEGAVRTAKARGLKKLRTVLLRDARVLKERTKDT